MIDRVLDIEEAAEGAPAHRDIVTTATDVTGKMFLRSVFAEGELGKWKIEATTTVGNGSLVVSVEHPDGKAAQVLVPVHKLIEPAAQFAIAIALGEA